MVRREGVEPSRLSTLDSKSSTATNYVTLACLVETEGIEPSLPCGTGLQSAHDPYVSTPPILRKLVWTTRFELVTTRFQSEDSGQTELRPENLEFKNYI